MGLLDRLIQTRFRALGRLALTAAILAWFVIPVPASGGALVVHGVATDASGMPIVAGTVQVRDSSGRSATFTTTKSGKFAAKLTGMTAPFLIEATPSSGNPLFSVAQGAGVANVDVLSDLIVTLVYKSAGTTPTAQFMTPTMSIPNVAQVGLAATLVKTSILRWIVADKLKPAQTDLITTAFSANGKKLDQLLRQITVVNNDYRITITDGVTTQSSTYGSPSSGTIQVATTTSSSAGSTSSVASTAVPTSAAELGALAGANALLANLQGAINKGGSNLTAADLSSFFAADFLDQGENSIYAQDDDATFLRGLKFSGIAIADIRQFTGDAPDGSHNLLDADFSATAGLAGVTENMVQHEVFECDQSNNCLFYGDQQIARTDHAVQVEYLVQNNPPINAPSINVDLPAPQGLISQATGAVLISGAAPFTSPTDTPYLFTGVKQFFPTPASPPVNYPEDHFAISAQPITPEPPPGTVYMFNLNLSAGGSATGETAINAVTGEPINLINPPLNGGTSIGNAPLGSTLKVEWTLPVTYAVSQIGLSGYVLNCANRNELQLKGDEKQIATTATSSTIRFPTVINDGQPGTTIDNAAINLQIRGVDGENSLAIVEWGGCI